MKKKLFTYFGSSFLFHLLWENFQAPLYQGYTSFNQHFWICLRATATGDMLFMLIIYAVLALVHRDAFWIAHKTNYTTMTWVIIILMGLLIGVSFEFWAVFIVHRWQYGSMPTALGIGLLPILQMIVVPSITLLISKSICIRISESKL